MTGSDWQGNTKKTVGLLYRFEHYRFAIQCDLNSSSSRAAHGGAKLEGRRDGVEDGRGWVKGEWKVGGR